MVSEENAAEENNSPSQENTPSPGRMLRERREALGLSQQQVAEKLFLKANQINDLEEDRLDDNASITFTKGYVRNYAKQLGLDSAAVIDAFEQKHVKADPPAKLQSFSRRVAKQTHDDRWMMVTYLILLLIIAGIVAWWYQQPSDDTQPEESIVSSVKEEAGSTPLPASSTVGGTSTDDGNNTVSAVDSVNSQSIQQESDNPELPSNNNRIQSAGEQSNEQAINVPDESNNLTALITQNDDSTVDLGNVTNTSTTGDLPPISMTFTFDADCWVNIKDATGEAIAYGVKQSGRVMEIQGVPPVEVTLGAPDNVRISVNGEPVDISAYQNGRTSRFSLPI
jgi:cytoskeleton protein RodZ